MQKLDLDSECACGEEIKFTMNKPKAGQPTIAKPVCKKCGSKYMIRLTKMGKQMSLDLKELYISPEAYAKVADEVRQMNGQ